MSQPRDVGLGRLWADWRSSWVQGLGDGESAAAEPDVECVLCRAIALDSPESDHVVVRGRHVVAIMNLYPYSNGHLMVLPVAHVGRLDQLDDETSAELWSLVEDSVTAVRRAFEPGGVNVGANLGAAAGAGVPDHLHVHVVPRWRGDTNFMTTIGEVRVLPESLAESARRLRDAWPEPGRGRSLSIPFDG